MTTSRVPTATSFFLAFAMSACGNAPVDDSTTVGALGDQNVGQNCNGFLGLADSCDGAYPYKSTTTDGKCLCRATPCSIAGTLLDENGAAHSDLILHLTTNYDSSQIRTDPDGNFSTTAACTPATWLTVTTANGTTQLFPHLGDHDLVVDSRTNPSVNITVVLSGFPTDGPSGPPASGCYDPQAQQYVEEGQCLHDPSAPSVGYKCTAGVPTLSSDCDLSSCDWNGAKQEGFCDYNDQGQACTCQHDTTWACADGSC